MNFDMIEGLTEQDIMQLYESSLLDNDGVYIGCCCSSPSGYVYFGFEAPGVDTHFFRGYCSMQILSASDCQAWCSGHRFAYLYFLGFCWCPSIGADSNWASCSR